MTEPVLAVKQLTQYFRLKGSLFSKAHYVRAVDGVSFSLQQGETLGLVGESGCGKSTLGRTILHLYKPTSGQVIYRGQPLNQLTRRELRNIRRDLQIVFQDPMASLNSRHTVGDIIGEPLIVHRVGTPDTRLEKVKNLLQKAGLPHDAINRYPHEFSGGQRQRISIARAIALEPKILVCDESVSALDVSVQSQILNLLMALQRDMNLSMIFIAHDLSVVKHISDRIAVMYLGRIVETGTTEQIYQNARHPYTQSLIAAIPVPDPFKRKARHVLQGDVPSPITPPSGCHFHTRCPYAQEQCKTTEPELTRIDATHDVACVRLGELP